MRSVLNGLSYLEKRQLSTWSSSEEPNPKLVRNSNIILGIDNGKTVTQISEELGISRETVSKIRDRFVVFRLDGIECDASRVGRRPTIWGEKAQVVLCTLLYANPPNGSRWTGQDLANERNLPVSTTYKFLKLKGISLDDPRTIHEALDENNLEISEIGGLFLSPIVSAMAFSCEARRSSTIATSPTRTTFYPKENVQAYFSRESEAFFKVVDNITGELLLKVPRKAQNMAFSFFLKLLDGSIEKDREILIVTNNLEITKGTRTMQWFERRPRFHVVDSLGTDGFFRLLRRHIGSVKEGKKKMIALQLEYLVDSITKWRGEPRWHLGVFSSISPLK